MKVVNFNIQEFEKFLNKTFVEYISTNQKILVLGIADGGIPVSVIVSNYLKTETKNIVENESILVQRPSTKVKKKSLQREKMLKSIFKILPILILDYLRISEHKKLSKRTENDLIREVKYNSEIDFSIYDLILIVDDAVDSGASMKAVFDDLSAKISGLIIKTLSVVVTQRKPIFEPDYFQFRDVLIRFPWSLDGKK